VSRKRRQHEAQFKFKGALEAVRGLKTVSQIASEHQVHPNLVSGWKKQLLDEGPTVFSRAAVRHPLDQAVREAELYEQIGRLKMELEWLKKKAASVA